MSRNLTDKEGEDGFIHVQETSRNLLKLDHRELGKITDEAEDKLAMLWSLGLWKRQ